MNLDVVAINEYGLFHFYRCSFWHFSHVVRSSMPNTWWKLNSLLSYCQTWRYYFQAYLFKFDSVHGRFDGKVEEKNGQLCIEGKAIHVFNEENPSAIGWRKAEAQYIVEATGIFTTKEKYVFFGTYFLSILKLTCLLQSRSSFEGWCQESYHYSTLERRSNVYLRC